MIEISTPALASRPGLTVERLRTSTLLRLSLSGTMRTGLPFA
jgi:hypothetical protein